MTRSTKALIVASIFTALTLPATRAQEATHTLPKSAHHAWGGALFQLGSSPRFRTQRVFRGDHLQPGTVISAISTRGDRSRASATYSANLRVRFENTTLAPGQLDRTLDNNFRGGEQTVIARKPVTVPALPPPADPNDARGQWFVLDTPFVFTGPNLLIDIDEDNRSTPYGQFWDGITMESSQQFHGSAESTRCGGTISANWSGGTYSLALSGMAANSAATIVVGFENQSWNGLALPYDLGGSGLAGCSLGVAPVLSANVATGASGTGRLQVPLPAAATSIAFSVQGVHPTGIGGQGLATTNTIHSLLGRSGSWDVVISFDGVSAPAGFPAGYNLGAVLLLR